MTRGATRAVRLPKPGKTPRIFQIQGKISVLLVLPHMAPLDAYRFLS